MSEAAEFSSGFIVKGSLGSLDGGDPTPQTSIIPASSTGATNTPSVSRDTIGSEETFNTRGRRRSSTHKAKQAVESEDSEDDENHEDDSDMKHSRGRKGSKSSGELSVSNLGVDQDDRDTNQMIKETNYLYWKCSFCHKNQLPAFLFVKDPSGRLSNPPYPLDQKHRSATCFNCRQKNKFITWKKREEAMLDKKDPRIPLKARRKFIGELDYAISGYATALDQMRLSYDLSRVELCREQLHNKEVFENIDGEKWNFPHFFTKMDPNRAKNANRDGIDFLGPNEAPDKSKITGFVADNRGARSGFSYGPLPPAATVTEGGSKSSSRKRRAAEETESTGGRASRKRRVSSHDAEVNNDNIGEDGLPTIKYSYAYPEPEPESLKGKFKPSQFWFKDLDRKDTDLNIAAQYFRLGADLMEQASMNGMSKEEKDWFCENVLRLPFDNLSFPTWLNNIANVVKATKRD